MRRARTGAALWLGMAALAVVPSACTPRGEVVDAAEPERRAAQLSLTFTRIAGGEGLRFEGQGHFARYAASDAKHLPAILGLPEDDQIPLDTCRSIDQAAALDRALSAARSTLPVRLLDAGRIQIRGPHDVAALSSRHYPELTPYVGGVVYGNEDALPVALEPGAAYEVSAEGGEEVGPLTAQVVAPREFPTLDVPVFFRDGDLKLRWREAGEPSGPLVLSVSWSERGAAREVRCRVRDDGSFTIGRELLAALPPASRLLSAEVAALRTRTAPISTPGIDRGELRVGLRDVVPLPVVSSPASPSAAAAAPAAAPPPAGGEER